MDGGSGAPALCSFIGYRTYHIHLIMRAPVFVNVNRYRPIGTKSGEPINKQVMDRFFSEKATMISIVQCDE